MFKTIDIKQHVPHKSILRLKFYVIPIYIYTANAYK